MAYAAAATAAVGLAGSLLGGGGGAAVPQQANFGATNITFGSVNFKSAGAGDRGKTTGAAEAATEAALSAGNYSQTPGWLWPVVGLVGAVLLIFVLFKPKK